MRKTVAKKVANVAKKVADKVIGKSFPLCVYEVAPPKKTHSEKRKDEK